MKSLFNKALIKEQLKRYWAIGALSFLVYFLSCLLPIWNASSPGSASSTMLTIMEMGSPFIIIINIAAPLAAVIALFSYMYRQNSTGVIHSLPFTKKQLFASNVLAGYILIAVPLIVFSLLLLCTPVAFSGDFNYSFTGDTYSYSRWIAINIFPNGLVYGDIINTLPVMAGFLARTLLSFTFYYALFITAAMVVGNQVMYFLVSLIFPFLAAGLYLLFGLIAFYYVYGYSFEGDLLAQILVYTNPVGIPAVFTTASSLEPYTVDVNSLAPYYAAYGLLTVILTAVSAWLYHSRRLERAGDTVVFSPLKNFFIFLLSVTGMVSLGVFLLAILNSVTFMYVGFVIGFVVSFFIAQMIAEKSFNVFYKYKSLLKHGGAALGLFAMIFIAIQMDITGYVKYVPETSEIDGVYFGWIRQYETYEMKDVIMDELFINDPQIIEEATARHRQIIDDRRAQRKVFLQNLASEYRGTRIPSRYQRVNYRLKDGTIVTREYVLSEEFWKSSGLSELMLSEPVIISDVFWVNLPELMENVTIEPNRYIVQEDENKSSYNYYNYTTLKIFERGEIASLMDALKKDYIYMKANELQDVEPVDGSLRLSIYSQANETYNRVRSYYMDLNYHVNTLAWLDEHGYVLEEME